MSLATRCTACGTVFRVVQDQLKISEGWVRCGRCDEVFNALEGLFDLERETSADWSPLGPKVKMEPASRTEAPMPLDEPAVTDHLLVEKIDAQLLQSRRGDDNSTPAMRMLERDRLDFPDARFEPDGKEEEEVEPASVFAQAGDAPASRADAPASSAWAAPTMPAGPEVLSPFSGPGQASGRRRKPILVAAACLGAMGLGVLLASQTAHHFRDAVAARWPGLQPATALWCRALRCTIRPPMRIDDISVQSTSLTRAATPGAFRLAVTLRNHGSVMVAMPSIDLSLTDPSGVLVARRVLAVQQPTIAGSVTAIQPLQPLQPGMESAQQWILDAGDARIAGYTVEVFYP